MSGAAESAGSVDVAAEMSGDLPAELYVVLGRLVRSLRREQGEAQLSVGLVSALRQLSDNGAMRATALAEAEGIAAASMTRVLNALEERDLIRRTPDPSDGRAQLVQLTETGRRALAEGAGVRVAALRRRIAALSDAERRALEGALPALARLEMRVDEA